jgi:starvation-inducible DNA-binding protein
MATVKTKTLATRNDLKPEVREKMIDLLNRQLADTFDLYSQTKQAHWNVRGPDFIQLHELYDELAEQVLGYVDLIAERAAALGGKAMGTARMAAASTRLPEFPDAILNGLDSVEALVERFAGLAETSRKAADQCEEQGDMATNDLFIEVTRGLDKSLWFLEAHLQGGQ